MASGVLMACKRYMRRPIRSIAYAVVVVVVLIFVARSCSLVGGPVSGRVVDIDTGLPLENAEVIVRWDADPPGFYAHPICFHVEAARSASDGTYRVPAWVRYPPVTLFGIGHVSDAYRQGYESVHANNEDPETSNVYMRKFSGSGAERFDFISGRVFSGMSCFGAGASRRNLFSLRKAALAEAKGLASTEQQKRALQGMRSIAAVDWLGPSSDSPGLSEPLAIVPAEVRRQLE